MALATKTGVTQSLSLPDELVLMLLNEESGYFRQIPGWNLNCAIVGAVLAELSLDSRIDTDMESLILLDQTETGDPVLDPILKEIASEPVQRNAQYWIERLAPRAELIIDLTLDRLVDLQILQHHEGDFWSLANTAWQTDLFSSSREGTAAEFVRTRISRVIFSNEIPSPRDIILVCLINTCDLFRFMFQLEDESEERIQLICKMDLIGRSIAEAVSVNITGPRLRRSALSKSIPTVPLRRLLLNPHARGGSIPALFADLAEKHGPVFEIRPPFKKPMIFLAGPETNHWAHRHGRMYLRSRDYLHDFEKIYGASGLLPALDGADHFRLRKSLQLGYSRARLEGQVDQLYRLARMHMADWTVGDSVPMVTLCRRLMNAQISPLLASVDSQDLFDDLVKFKERALKTMLLGVMPKFLLHTPSMRRRAKKIDVLMERVQSSHTPAQRAGCPRDLADELLSLHASDPQFLPESNLRFNFTAPVIASMYGGDTLSFVVYAMVSQPALYERIRSEADALFDGGDPDGKDFTPSAIDVTRRFVMECLRLYPIIPMSVRNVMNTCVVEDYELPEGAQVYIAQTATHYMSDAFPEPLSFDIDRYLPPRDEHVGPNYAPFGLGTHKCLGARWVELQVAINLLMLAHYFTFELSPPNAKLRVNMFPSMSIKKKVKCVIAEQRRELNV